MTAPGWYKDAIFYELRIRAFYDSNGDGIGDIRGLTEKLDYLHDLGITTIWLLPFYPSPLRDDGYDIADYANVDHAVGTLKDFKRLVKAAHDRGLRVVTELVLNHTSDQHAWFQRARRAPAGSPERNFYVWSDTADRYRDARIIFTDYESSNWTWDPLAKAYYWHRFFSHQPDLNFGTPEVRREIYSVVDFWLDMGVDGLRLDAVPYLFEREGTSCENLPETHDFLRELRQHVDRNYADRMLLAEANQWPEDAAAYFGKGDECHMAFHFPIMPRLYLALRMEDSFPILDILEQTPAIPDPAQWAIFLRNHDELTLEMVTEDERDLMLRAYAREPQMRVNLGIRRRLAPLLDNNRRRIELMNALLMSLPGTPVVYYGDEIGMGDNVYLGDRNGVRTPMQWSPDRNAGFSRANPQRLFLPPIVDPEYHYESINVENQQRNPSSLLWWMKRLIALRKDHIAFGRGSFTPLSASNRSIFAFVREYAGHTILVVANLRRFPQSVDLDLNSYRGAIPIELFGGTKFPPIGAGPYRLSLGPHDFLWFSIEQPLTASMQLKAEALTAPTFQARTHWSELLEPGRRSLGMERALGDWLIHRRWFRSKSRRVKTARIAESVALGGQNDARLVFLEVAFTAGEMETYVLVLGVGGAHSDTAIAVIKKAGEAPMELVDASENPKTALRLLELTRAKKRWTTRLGELWGRPEKSLRALQKTPEPVRRVGGDQSNTCFCFADEIVLKLIRKLDEGRSAEVDVLSELAPRAAELRIPRLLGQLELERNGIPTTIASVTSFIPHQGDAWQYTVGEIDRFFERALARRNEPGAIPQRSRIVGKPDDVLPPIATELAGGFLEATRLLGRRTAELHQALAKAPRADFSPLTFGGLARRAMYQHLRSQAARVFETIRVEEPRLPETARPLARAVLKRRREADRRMRALLTLADGGRLIRVHGDYHLGQLLYTGSDFSIIDFEGEPARTPAERHRRRSPLVDVAGMLRSLHYAVEGVLRGELPVHGPRTEDLALLRPWADAWYSWVSHAFVQSYLGALEGIELLPRDPRELAILLDVFLIEKALYEVAYELDSRPHWVPIPLAGLCELLG